jgi:hypothetical protein
LFFLPDSARAHLVIWDIILTKKWPNHKEVQTLKQRPLGKLTT